MSNGNDGNDNVMRMNVHVVREEHPDLFEELKKFGKGIKRIQRLKTLASERLLLTGRTVAATAEVRSDAATPSQRAAVEEDEMAAVHELCLPPLK